MEGVVLGTEIASILFLFVGAAPIVYYVTNTVKGLTNAYLYDKKKRERDPWWYQTIWRVVPLVLGAIIGVLMDQTEFYVLPVGIITGTLSGVFCVLLYRKIRDTLSGADPAAVLRDAAGKKRDPNE